MKKIISIILLCLFLVSCSESSGQPFSPQNFSTVYFDIEFDLSDSEKVNFGYIRNIYVDLYDNIFVADAGTNSILIFSPGGQLIKEFRNQGQGPGEFLTIAQIYINHNSLFIVDSQQLKVSEFEILNDEGDLIHISDTIYPDRAFRRVVNFWSWDKNRFLFVFGEGFSAHDLWKPKFEVVEFFDKKTKKYEQAFRSPQKEYFRYSNDRGFGVRPLPYGTKPTFAYSDKQLFYGHNSKFEIFKLSFDNTTVSKPIFSIQLNSEPISSDERQAIIEDEYYINRNLASEIREQIPEAWPFYDSFIIDDERNFWFSVNHSEYREGELYWVFDETGNELYETILNEPVALKAIRNGSAYGVRESDMGVHSLVKYSISK